MGSNKKLVINTVSRPASRHRNQNHRHRNQNHRHLDRSGEICYITAVYKETPPPPPVISTVVERSVTLQH